MRSSLLSRDRTWLLTRSIVLALLVAGAVWEFMRTGASASMVAMIGVASLGVLLAGWIWLRGRSEKAAGSARVMPLRSGRRARLLNQRELVACTRGELRRSSRTGKPLSILYLDIHDGREYVPARSGGHTGTNAEVIVQALLGFLRSTDAVALTSTGEIAIVLPATDRQGADFIASVLIRTLENASISDHPARRPVVGVVTCLDGRVVVEDFFQQAYQALYEARAGRQGEEPCATRGGPHPAHSSLVRHPPPTTGEG
jgi:GGDEF domain-containing protein